MKMVKCIRSLWRLWCDLWQLRWEEFPGIDYSKWESKVEMRCRLSGPTRDICRREP